MNREELLAKAEGIRWYHTMNLGQCVITRGYFNPALVVDSYGIPADLTGKHVLDVGAWDGWFSFECERRGAMVVAADKFCWGCGGAASWGSKAGFNLAHKVYGSSVVAVWADPHELCAVLADGAFDLVLFLGVLYHLRDPLRALEVAVSLLKPGGLIIVESHVASELQDKPFPAARLYKPGELRHGTTVGDVTNVWGPNVLAIEAMLTNAGATDTKLVSIGGRVEPLQGSQRAIVHARKPEEVTS